MGRKFTGKTTVNRAKIRQKNGDYYIYERKYSYNPDTKRTEMTANKLVAKIPKGSSEEVPTRKKKRNSENDDQKSPKSEANKTVMAASRQHTGLTDILAYVGEASGIDDALMASTDEDTAKKIISIARFLVATGGDTLPHIETWQLTHPIPYNRGITQDIYYKLCKDIGIDETLRQRLFAERCKHLGERPLIAFDSTTQSTYSEMQIEARYGFNKDGDGLRTIKLLTLYSLENRQPIAFAKQPGNLPDVTSLSNTLQQMEALGLHGAELVTDNGYYSDMNLSEMCYHRLHFITLVKTQLAWVKKEIEAHRNEIVSIANRKADLGTVYCLTARVKRTFIHERKHADRKNGIEKGAVIKYNRRIYLHIYFSPERKEKEDSAFYERVDEVKELLESGTALESLTTAGQAIAHKYLKTSVKKGKPSCEYLIPECQDSCKYHGFFALVSNHEEDRFLALRKYRKREKIEEYFQMAKDDAGANRPRVWFSDHLMGRLLIQFIALSYEDFLRYKIAIIKENLGKENGDPDHDKKARLEQESSLKKWLQNTSFSNILRWFDAYETTEVSSAVLNRRWNSETTKRDRLFLELLGIT